MEFYGNDKVIVNPLRVRPRILHELEINLVLYFTATSRESAAIVRKEQVKNVNNKNEKSIEAMHQLKEQARMMKESLLRGKLDQFGEILDFGFQQKSKWQPTSVTILLKNTYTAAKKAGATGGKIDNTMVVDL